MSSAKIIYDAGGIKSTAKLLETLNISQEELHAVLTLNSSERYTEPSKPIFKKDGSKRLIKNPIGKLRRIQNRINRRIIKPNIIWPDYLFGSIPKNSNNPNIQDYVSSAAVHCESKSLLKLDVSNFFDNIHLDDVTNVFRKLFRFDLEVSKVLADLCCFEDRLVQGALTSSYIATLIFWDIEPDTVSRLRKYRLKYSRLVDDITISSDDPHQDYSYAERTIKDMLFVRGLPVNENKLEVHRLNNIPITVHGLQVNYKRPCYSKKEINNIRASVHQIEKRANIDKDKKSYSYRADYYRLLGRVNKLHRVKNGKYFSLLKRLQSELVKPKASGKDLKSAYNRIVRLEENFDSQKSLYQYYKRYNYLKYLLFYIKEHGENKHKLKAQELLTRVKNIEPVFIKSEEG